MNQERTNATHMQKNDFTSTATSTVFLCLPQPTRNAFLFDDFASPKPVFTPMVSNRFWFSRYYYEGFELPDTRDFNRGCGVEGRLYYDAPAGPAGLAREIVKLYYDYALGRRKRRVWSKPHLSRFCLSYRTGGTTPAARRTSFQGSAGDKALGLV